MASNKRHIVIAIDFGTTYSGVAWAQASNPTEHFVIDEWPRSISDPLGKVNSEKVPTELAYNYDDSGHQIVWGFQIPDEMPRLQWLKLDLDPKQKSTLADTKVCAYQDGRRMERPHHATAESVVTDYMRALIEHARAVIKRRVGSAFDSMEFSYVITVPAVWSERAKLQTRICAELAGIDSDIQMVSEPEAAAIHTLNASHPHNLQVGDTIVICDAGGGTVDLITFTILRLEPTLRLKEAAPGHGALRGSTFVHRQFENFLRKLLSNCVGWEGDTLSQAMVRFEAVAKMFGGDPQDGVSIPVPGIPDNMELGIRRGFLRLTGEVIIKLFEPSMETIWDLITEQIQVSEKDIAAVFLVGGFGQNDYLYKFLRARLSDKIVLISPVHGWTAVVRGGLTKRLASYCSSAPQVFIESRVARKHYGHEMGTEFDPLVHDDTKKYWSSFHGNYRISVMDWFIHKGDTLKEGEPIITNWYKTRLKASGEFKSIFLEWFECDTPEGIDPPFYCNHGLKQHATLNPQLNRISRKRIPIVLGADGQKHYRISFQIRAQYYSAHCEYSLWFKGENQGSVRAEYH